MHGLTIEHIVNLHNIHVTHTIWHSEFVLKVVPLQEIYEQSLKFLHTS